MSHLPPEEVTSMQVYILLQEVAKEQKQRLAALEARLHALESETADSVQLFKSSKDVVRFIKFTGYLAGVAVSVYGLIHAMGIR